MSGTKWGACTGAVTPTTEVCNGVDDDCNGQVDEGCICMPGTTITCYSGPNGTQDVGLCHGGTKTCLPDGSGYGDCTGEVTPITEVCGNGMDDDCDGQVDQGCIQCSTQTVVWDIPIGTTGGPNCITTGGGKCTEVLNCNGSTCSPQSCGTFHCGTLTCNDGTYTHLEYCSVLASCSAGGVTSTGFTW
ncbi:MAG: MopE-related protein [Minicystis sp.]